MADDFINFLKGKTVLAVLCEPSRIDPLIERISIAFEDKSVLMISAYKDNSLTVNIIEDDNNQVLIGMDKEKETT